MKKFKKIWTGIFSSLAFTTTLIATPMVITSCNEAGGDSNHINSLEEFNYEVTNIYHYTNELLERDTGETPHVDSTLGHKKGIILTGWKNGPYVIPKTNTVLIHPANEYQVDGETLPVIAYGELAFGQEMFDDWNPFTGSKYNYKFIMPESLILMYNSACSWFGAIPTYELPICVNSVYDLTGREAMYPHISVDMSKCDKYRDSEDSIGGLRGIFNYNFAFQNIDNFIWPTSNYTWDRIVDDMFEDAYIKCDMDLRGLKELKEIGHWGCGRWQMPNNDVYLPETINSITWEAFNGSRFRNIYWNVVNPTDLTWNNYEIDTDAIYTQICVAIDGFVENHPDYRWMQIMEPLIEIALDEFKNSMLDHDWYIFGNLEFKNLYISDEAGGQDILDWNEYFSSDETENSESRGVSLPEIFWALGMADCPETSSIGNINPTIE